MHNKAVDNYALGLEFASGCYNSQQMCDKAVDTYPSTIKCVPECFMTKEMSDKAFNRCFFVFNSIPDQYKTQEMRDRVVSQDPFLILYCPNQHKTQKMWDKAVDDPLGALKLMPYWFVTNKMIKKLFTALYADENILYFNEDSGNVVFSCNEMGILNIDLNNINLDHNFDADDSDTIILIRLLVWQIKFEERKELKRDLNEELMLVAWHPKRWWDFSLSEDDKKEIDPIFIDDL